MNDSILSELYEKILERKKEAETKENEKSYTKYLFHEGINKILKKVGEESAETIIAAKDAKNGDGSKNRDCNALLVGEVADLFYHVFVMLAEVGIDYAEVEKELAERSKKMGNLKAFGTEN